MAIHFTPKQNEVLNARGHNVLVSAAAGSGKTAVLVERIIRMITGENGRKVDIDRLLVVTFTRAAAAQMRERIGEAISKRLEETPDDAHLQRQETLLHHAQITTIDSFCTFLLRNHFSEIGLDPSFRQMDETESSLILQETLRNFIEEKYQENDPAYLSCVQYFCPGSDDKALEGLITKLYRAADSHVSRVNWLETRRQDYLIPDTGAYFASTKVRKVLAQGMTTLEQVWKLYDRMLSLCEEPGGPYPYADFLEQEREGIFAIYGMLDPYAQLQKDAAVCAEKIGTSTDAADNHIEDDVRSTEAAASHIEAVNFTTNLPDPAAVVAAWNRVCAAAAASFGRLPAIRGKKYEDVDEEKKAQVKALREEAKTQIEGLHNGFFAQDAESAAYMMRKAAPAMDELITLTEEFITAFDAAKKKKNAIDFSDLERLALQVLYADPLEAQVQDAPSATQGEQIQDVSTAAKEGRIHDATMPAKKGRLQVSKAAISLQQYYDEILIDEYQDSNEVQELLLSTIAGERSTPGADTSPFKPHWCGKENDPDGLIAEGNPSGISPSAPPENSGKEKAWAASPRPRFMVGDVKQSIYRFRNARPDIFVRKFDTYKVHDPVCERIDLDQNFRSRKEVLDSVNEVFQKIMRREIGGVEYDDTVSLKPGADFPSPEGLDPYTTELLVVTSAEAADGGNSADGDSEKSTTGKKEESGASAAGGKTTGPAAAVGNGTDPDSDGDAGEDSVAELSTHEKEALAVAQQIRSLVAQQLLIRGSDGAMAPVRYKDIVILVRSAASYNDAFRIVFEREGIPLYVDNKTGYFAAEEVRQVLQFLRVLDNPRQDIPLYGVLRGYFGGFSEEEIAAIRANDKKSVQLYDALTSYAEADTAGTDQTGSDFSTTRDPQLQERLRVFLERLDALRNAACTQTISELLRHILYDTGYLDYCNALPRGEQRLANVQELLVKAADFEKAQYTGLFRFLRYIDQMHEFQVDYGEAGVLDENADVVRLMTIHKSKGLEFPVCFVCGLGSRLAFRGKDTTGALLTDADAGCGIDYCDLDLRFSIPTLQKRMVARRIMQESLGEELRVLYVAMTRAKEKLYLAGSVPDLAAKQQALQTILQVSGKEDRGHLPVPAITRCTSFLDLILMSLLSGAGKETEEFSAGTGTESDREASAGTGRESDREAGSPGSRAADTAKSSVRTKEIRISDLQLEEVLDQASMAQRLTTLSDIAEGRQQPEEDGTAALLEKRFSYRYPHKDLEGLYTKTTVSELKRAAIEDDSDGERIGEGAASIFPESVPFFEGKTGDRITDAIDAASRGTAIHKGCELINYQRWSTPSDVNRETFDAWVNSLIAAGKIPLEYGSVILYETFIPFLRSGIASRMAAADQKGWLRREQPFVYGVPARQLNASFPQEETVLVQGVIDAFFIEEDKEEANPLFSLQNPGTNAALRHIILVDYKTDHVHTAKELADRYRTQLDYYAEALEGMLQLPVAQKLIYSFYLGEEIAL